MNANTHSESMEMSETDSTDGSDRLGAMRQLLEDLRYAQLKTRRERIEYILKTEMHFEQFRNEIRNRVEEYRQNHRKSETTAKKFRESGSKFLELKDYKFALKAYNRVRLDLYFNI